MPVTNAVELYGALGKEQAGEPEIVGTLESGWVDFKRDAYPFDSDRSKLEFAKDVSAFANEDGGVVVVGIATERDSQQPVERASKFNPVPRSLLDCDRIAKLISEYVYPILDPPVRCWVWPMTETQGIMTIEVLPQPHDHKPFITSMGLDEKIGDARGNMFGYYRRQGDSIPTIPAEWV